jgi:hypothetical protein
LAAQLIEPDVLIYARVVVSTARFTDLATATSGSDTSASVTAMGPEGETIEVAWLAPGSTTPTIVKCVMPRGSAVSVQIGTAMKEGQCVQV